MIIKRERDEEIKKEQEKLVQKIHIMIKIILKMYSLEWLK